MLWSKVDQTAAARQAVTTVETEKLRGQSRGIQRTWPGCTWSVLIELSCRISWMTCRVSAFGSYASASVHRLCPGRTSTLVNVAPAVPGRTVAPECPIACAALARATDPAAT